jgi:hypothetical protein
VSPASSSGMSRSQKVCCFPCQQALSDSVPIGRAQAPLWRDRQQKAQVTA